MNAISLLKQQHSNVEDLFHRFETTPDTEAAELASIRDTILEQLSMHAAVEEQVFYPTLRAKLGDERQSTVLEGIEEHHIVKVLLSELEKMASADERFRPKMTVLIENVRHHVEEEEEQLFAEARDAFTVEELNDLGDTMEKVQPVTPTRAHPFVPDQPPFNIIIGLPVAIADRSITFAKDIVGDVVEVLRNANKGTKAA